MKLIAAAAVLALAGCGQAAATSHQASHQASHLVRQAAVICAQLRASSLPAAAYDLYITREVGRAARGGNATPAQVAAVKRDAAAQVRAHCPAFSSLTTGG